MARRTTTSRPQGCCGYVERLRKAGKDITLTEYPWSASLSFDNPALKNPVKLSQAQATCRCPLLKEASDGRIVNSQTKAMDVKRPLCVERGTTIAYDPQAHAEVVKGNQRVSNRHVAAELRRRRHDAQPVVYGLPPIRK